MRRIVPLICAALLCALPASASAAPDATDFELRVGAAGPTARAASAGETAWTSGVLRPGRRFHVFGLKWRDAGEHVHAQVRVRERGGRWRRWTDVPHGHDAATSDPIWAGGADELQIRLDGRVRGLRVHFVRVTGLRTGRAGGGRGPRARAAQAGPPRIITRAEWGGTTQCRPRDEPTYGQVQMAVVHHTVSANDYGPEDSAAMVLGICRFHRNSNGWDDIGYNFLVDQYGQVFEGRAGGVDRPVVGAQAQGWNSVSTGIANLGTYSAVPQSDAAVSAMASLIAWKLPLHGIPVTGQVALQSAGGSTNRYASGTLVTFERISGHRDGNSTECPGGQLYAQLPAIRALAAQRAPDIALAPSPLTPLTLDASRLSVSWPESTQLSGAFHTPDGVPVAGAEVHIQVLTARGFKSVRTVHTGPDGRFATEFKSTRNRSIRAKVGSVVSQAISLRVAPAVEMRRPHRRILRGRRAVLRGKLAPRKRRVTIEAARQVGGTDFDRVGRFTVRARRGHFRAAVRLERAGVYRLRVLFKGDRRNSPTQVDTYIRAVRDREDVTDELAELVPASAAVGRGDR